MRKFFVMVLVLFVTACGGGGGDGGVSGPAGPSPAEGLWYGTTNTNRSVAGIVLDDGTFYVLYSLSGSPNYIAGVVQGNASASNGTYSSSNAKDFNFGDGIGIVNVSLSGTYTTKQSFTGTAVYGGNLGTTTFSTLYSSDYEITPTLSAIAGTYTGQMVASAGYGSATISISTGGSISGNNGGCTVAGTVTPRSRGNVYNGSITFGGSPCVYPNQSFSGIIYYDADYQAIYAIVPNAARTDGILFVGSK